MGVKFVLTVVPGKQINQNIQPLAPVQAIDISNGTPFDLDITGFGSIDITVLPAGLMNRYYAKVNNTGRVSILPVNNNNVVGTGVVNITTYYVTEQLPPGNFPCTVPVQVVQATVSGVQTLSNEGSTLGSEVEDIGTTANPRLIDIFNNHFSLSIEIGGVKHTILQGSLSGSPAQAGQSGDVWEFLGQILVDQLATFTDNIIANGGINLGTLRDNSTGSQQATLATAGISITNVLTLLLGAIMPNGQSLQSKDTGGTVRNLIGEDGANDVTFNPGSANFYRYNNTAGAATFGIDTGGVNALLQAQNAAHSAVAYPIGSIRGWQRVTGSVAAGPTTISHGLGAIPDFACITQEQASADTFNFIYDKANSTTTTAKFWGSAGAVTARPFAALLIVF